MLINQVKAVKIPFQHGEISHHMMGKKNWLSPLKVGITRHNYILMLLRYFQEGLL